jgi:DEAD/DEAH box helicase domain-containing protein
MTPLDNVVHFLENRFSHNVHSHQVLEPQTGSYAEFPEALDERLQDTLRKDGIDALYSHQAEAFKHISGGTNTVLVSQTASGKTLSFLLPILNAYMNAPAPFSVLLLYPTKALSRDQEGTLGKLMKAAGAKLSLGTFDGDTPTDERTRIQRNADFVITNPDMLHSGILPNHSRRWKPFLSRLRYIVVDEVHMYRGAFGSHVSNVFRRLMRACEVHGASPTFVCCSATIGNPQAHVEALFHAPFTLVNRDGSPRPRRDLYMINPPMVQSAGFAAYRKGTGSISAPLIREAARAGVRTICFCRARQQVERLRRAVVDGHPDLRDKVKPYRGGLLPNERRQLERDLFSGKTTTIITTNALELGIDIGDLELCILSGHPGSLASFWQQAGRVGRRGPRAVIAYVAKDAPIDQYLVNHPDFVTETPLEQAWLNADNPYILLQHLPCAAHEHPLRDSEPRFPGVAYDAALDALREENVVTPYRDCYRYALRDYPARGVNLRGMTDYNIEIVCGSEVIGEIDPIGARGELYKDAIYQHLGRRYMSIDLDLDKKLCQVEVVNVDYYTVATWENRITMSEVDISDQLCEHRIDFGFVNVNKQAKLYKKIRERSFENIGYGPITLDPFIYDTTGFCLLPARAWREALDAVDKRFVNAALYGLSYILRRVAPSLCMADVRDIDTDVSLIEVENEVWRSALYLFDTHEGGVGFAEKICELLPQALSLCATIINGCACTAGCPSCVPPLPPGADAEEMVDLLLESNAAIACTRSLLRSLADGSLEIPEVTNSPVTRGRPVTPPGEDQAALLRQRRMRRAAGILKQKRERLH